MKGYSDCNSTNTYCVGNRSVTENFSHFVPIYLSRATSWTRRSFDAPEVKIELYRFDLSIGAIMHVSTDTKISTPLDYGILAFSQVYIKRIY